MTWVVGDALRLWVGGGQVRLARDGEHGPEHLEEEGGLPVWRPHPEGGNLPTVSMAVFTAWLDQEASARPARMPSTPTVKE